MVVLQGRRQRLLDGRLLPVKAGKPGFWGRPLQLALGRDDFGGQRIGQLTRRSGIAVTARSL